MPAIRKTKTKDELKWDKDKNGTDGLTSDQRILEFLLEKPEYLSVMRVMRGPVKYRVAERKLEDSSFPADKKELAKLCHDYFLEKAVEYRSVEDIRCRMRDMMKMYREARKEYLAPGNGSMGLTNLSGSAEFKSMLVITNHSKKYLHIFIHQEQLEKYAHSTMTLNLTWKIDIFNKCVTYVKRQVC